jgi:hypothetical protein
MAPLPLPPPGLSPLAELAAGVDALYLSGKSSLPSALLESLEAGRAEAEGLGEAVPFNFAGITWRLGKSGFLKWRFCLDSDFGRVGLTASASIPTVRIQPRAELLHAIGPADTVAMFTDPIEAALGHVPWTVSRVDLHSDWQGWGLHRDMSERFMGRATARSIYESDDLCTGFTFGTRSGGSIYGRIYDKLADIAMKGNDYWFDVWGERFDPNLGVHRVEFEWGRAGLRSMQLRTPAEVLDAVGDLWAYSTNEWLTLRTQTADQTKARWPIDPDWSAIQGSQLAHDLLGLARLKQGSRKGMLRLLMPLLNGCVSSAAVHLGTTDIGDTLAALDLPLRDYERTSGMPFASRVDSKRREWGAA